jgi:hypothetical protein
VSDDLGDEPDAGRPAPDLDHPVFDEAFIAGGIKESTLRRLTAPPPKPTAPTRQRSTPDPFNQPAGPRDWAPTPTPRPRRRRWPWALIMSLGVGVALLVSVIRGGGGAAPLVVRGGQPNFTPAHSPIAAPSNDATGTTTNGPPVTGLNTATHLGTCFNLSGYDVRVTACTVPHRYQLVAFEAASGDNAHYPSDAYFNGPVRARCASDLVSYTGQPASRWPQTLEASSFDPRPDGWRVGDRVVYCVAEWVPPGRESVAHIAPALPPSVAGILVSVAGPGLPCLALRTPAGSTVLVLSEQSGYFATAGTLGQAGISKGEPPHGIVIKPVGSHVTLAGVVVAVKAQLGTCGLTRAVAFTSFH